MKMVCMKPTALNDNLVSISILPLRPAICSSPAHRRCTLPFSLRHIFLGCGRKHRNIIRRARATVEGEEPPPLPTERTPFSLPPTAITDTFPTATSPTPSAAGSGVTKNSAETADAHSLSLQSTSTSDRSIGYRSWGRGRLTAHLGLLPVHTYGAYLWASLRDGYRYPPAMTANTSTGKASSDTYGATEGDSKTWDEISSVASSEDNGELRQTKEKAAIVLDQQVDQGLEHDERMGGIESKTDDIALVLGQQAAQEHLDEQMRNVEAKMDGIELDLGQQATQGHRLNERMRNLESKADGVEDLVLNTSLKHTVRHVSQSAPSPSISRVIPDIGPTAGGSEIAVLGSHFPQSSRCFFGLEEAATTWRGVDCLMCILPPSKKPGIVPVTIKMDSSTIYDNTSPSGNLFTYQEDLYGEL